MQSGSIKLLASSKTDGAFAVRKDVNAKRRKEWMAHIVKVLSSPCISSQLNIGFRFFFPTAGNCNNGRVNNAGSNGNYWSSTPNDSNNAYNLNFNSGNQNVNNNNRNNGYSVRAVFSTC